MLRRWLALLLKPYIDELVDQRFKEKMYERYYESKQNDLQERIQRLRRNLSSPTQRIQTETKREEEPSGVLEVPRPEEPRVRKKNVKRKIDNSNWYEDTMKEVEKARKKREEMDALKKKLTAKNNWKK